MDTSAESAPCCPHDRDQPDDSRYDAEAELLALEAEEENKLRQEPEIAIHEDLETDDNEWLSACNWASWFKQKPIPLLVTETTVPPQAIPALLALASGMELNVRALRRPSGYYNCLQLPQERSKTVCGDVTAYATDASMLDSKLQSTPHSFDCPQVPRRTTLMIGTRVLKARQLGAHSPRRQR